MSEKKVEFMTNLFTGSVATTQEWRADFGPSHHAVLAVSCQHGIYAPQFFCELYGTQFIDADEEDIRVVLSGPDHPEYWEAWDLLSNRDILGTDGKQYYIFEDMDIWLEPVDPQMQEEVGGCTG